MVRFGAVGLHFERGGNGAPLLLVHGLGGSMAIWRPVRERLEAEREVLIVDMPGFGGSDPLPADRPATPAAIAQVLAAHCKAQGMARPHVVGNSLGAWVALEMAKAGQARSVCCLSPAGLWRNPLGPRPAEVQRVARRLRPLLLATLSTVRGRRAILRNFVAHPDRVPAADARALARGYADSTGYAAANEAMRAGAFEHDGELNVPVTIAWGAADRIVARPSPSRIPPGSRYMEMPGWGHTPTWDDPEGVARISLESSSG